MVISNNGFSKSKKIGVTKALYEKADETETNA
jgi:hypothetical protein